MRRILNFIVRILKKLFTRRGGTVFNAGRGIDVSKHWKIISIGFASLLVLLGILDGYVAWRIKGSIEADVTLPDVRTVTIEKDELEKAMNELEGKKKKFMEAL